MVLKLGTRLLFVLTTVLADMNCPVVTCGGLEDNVCTMLNTDRSITVNTNGCMAGWSCSVADVLKWWKETPTSKFMCASELVTMTNTTLTFTDCPSRVEKRNFKSGLGHVDCTNDSDCVLVDGTIITGSCQCTLRTNGKGLCVADINSYIYNDYWIQCQSNGLENSNMLDFWSFYMSMWIYVQVDVPCASFLQEVETVTLLYDTYMSSASSMMQVWFLFLVWIAN